MLLKIPGTKTLSLRAARQLGNRGRGCGDVHEVTALRA